MGVAITINGKTFNAREGQTILQICQENGVYIPTLCYHPNLSVDGSCRLCVVEVLPDKIEATACSLIAQNGMSVITESPKLSISRKFILELLLQNYYDENIGSPLIETEFLRLVKRYKAIIPPLQNKEPIYLKDSDPSPVILLDLNKCILCTRCVRSCTEIQGRFVLSVDKRGQSSKIIAGAGEDFLSARCESCGNCLAVCPTGAISSRLSVDLGFPDKLVRTTCPYCGVGCQFDINVKDNQIIGITSSLSASTNSIALCVKGRFGYDFVSHPERLKTPMVRDYLVNHGERKRGSDRGEWVSVSWEKALSIVAEKYYEIISDSGPDALGFLSSAKCTNEENYLMQKFARQVIGTNNVDHCARLCHASTVTGLAMSFGSGAMSNTMVDVASNAEAIFIIGSNTTEQHPVFGSMIRQAVRNRGVKLVVADPRKIDITEFATLHLQQKPGSDVALINGLTNIIITNNWQDVVSIQDRTEGFEEFRSTVEKYPPRLVAEITGVSETDLYQAAMILSQNKPMAVVWSMGITQHTTGVLNVLSLANLQMLLGNMGIPGGGVNPLRGQNNVQGACDLGALPNVLPGYQPVNDDKVEEKFHKAWKLNRPKSPKMSSTRMFPKKAGLTVTELINETNHGEIRALYIMGENPMMTDPNLNHVKECLNHSEFIVLQEIFPSETSRYADVMLPGASWAEKDGSFTNTERRIQLIRQAVSPPGDALPDWKILSNLALKFFQVSHMTPEGLYADWKYESSEQIMDEINGLTPSYAGVTFKRLSEGEQLHWPVKDSNHPGTPILHSGTFTRGLGKFHSTEHLPPDEMPDDDYPFYLTTGRVLYHWHGGQMTRRSKGLMGIYPEPLIEISPQDGIKLGILDGSYIQVESRRGKIISRVGITNRVSEGLIFGNFHFPGTQNVNYLTNPALDPVAKIPEYKVCAVKLDLV